MNARAAAVPLYVALVAAVIFVVGLVVQMPVLLDVGCVVLLLVPLARNVVVVVADARSALRLLAVVLSLGLIALYVLAWMGDA